MYILIFSKEIQILSHVHLQIWQCIHRMRLVRSQLCCTNDVILQHSWNSTEPKKRRLRTVCPLMTGRWLLPSWTWMTTVVELDSLTFSPWSLASTNTVNISATLGEEKGIDLKLCVCIFLIVPFRYKCFICNGISKDMWGYAKFLRNWVILLAARLTGVWLICLADMPFSPGHLFTDNRY